MRKILFNLFAMMCLLNVNTFAKEFVLDKAHTHVGFKIKHLQISNVKGNFQDYDAVIDFDPAKLEFKKLEALIRVNSINTENQARDNQLQQDDFFKTKQYPDMVFIMKHYEKIDNQKGKMSGKLTIAGVSKDIVLDTEIGGIIKDQDGKQKIGFSLNGKIKRSDFQFALGTSTIALSDEIELNIEVEANEK
ncbi:YceI family protein [Campylobacter hepaticus]|uniref:Polyisoprenoid-binding protein n=1 Tax=Campylobacter hepaticus TaxID=1813019 RepID=A0A424Z2U0_9BACT|nr:YceI family protein [Campylobacter hepaticus]AXP08159.1 polyisoprenoid-binding protein [Campylobacter hepaticus]MCZ0772753.1 YceI family protein [Campylobacter hepaticus]MCZ0774221.1 YceI family protein [Campylobacter hepaticus]MCZ0775473.1 YceI family protein [Campylobacter hepaticus]MDX2323244.1 YceI family protein [Campylobacter hepaticus]